MMYLQDREKEASQGLREGRKEKKLGAGTVDDR